MPIIPVPLDLPISSILHIWAWWLKTSATKSKPPACWVYFKKWYEWAAMDLGEQGHL
jgi:hypothetical protein